MTLRPVPISELRIGEFYDKSSKESVLILKLLPNIQAQVLAIGGCQYTVATIDVRALYPYQTLAKPMQIIPSINREFPREGTMNALSSEMERVLEENQWGFFHLPHFCEGYLPLYFSRLKQDAQIPEKQRKLNVGLNFLSGFFQTLLKHLLHTKPIAVKAEPWFAQVISSMCILADDICKYAETYHLDRAHLESLSSVKNSVLHALCPADLPPELGKFWSFCQCVSMQDVVALALDGKLTVLNLLRASSTLIAEIVKNDAEYYTVKRFLFCTCLPKDVVAIQLRILVAGIRADRLNLACLIAEHLCHLAVQSSSDITLSDLCTVFLEEELLKHVQLRKVRLLDSYLFKRPELFPVVLQYLNSAASTETRMPLENFLVCLTKRISLHDLDFLNFVVTNKVLSTKVFFDSKNPGEEIYSQLRRVVNAFWKQKIPTAFLKELFPPAVFGRFLFPKLAHNFSLAKTRKHMIGYYGSEEKYLEVARGDVKRYYRAGVDLWYIFAGSRVIQFMWIRRHSPSAPKLLSENLAREICGYLV